MPRLVMAGSLNRPGFILLPLRRGRWFNWRPRLYLEQLKDLHPGSHTPDMNESTETPTETTPEPTEQPGPSAIRVYVCPQCGCWYGSSEVTDLAEIHNHRSSMSNLASEDPSQWGASTGKRSMCQRCKSHGHNVERVLVTFIREDAIAKQFGIAMEQSA